MAAGIAAESREVLRARSQVRDTRSDHAARGLHEVRQAGATAPAARSLEHEPQSFLDQILDLAATQRRLCLGPTIDIVWHFHGGFHSALTSGAHIPIIMEDLPRLSVLEVSLSPGVARAATAASRTDPPQT